MISDYKYISYNHKEYAVFQIKYKETNLPVVMDWNDFKIINKMKKRWRCNNSGFVSSSNNNSNTKKEVFLHELIMNLRNKKNINKSIIHVNRVGLDNRTENLMYDLPNKEINKNGKKKQRTIHLPESGINISKIPTYVWYMKADGTHGERFVVDIGDIKWKTTSSNHVSLKYKLEEAKLFLRHLFRSRSDLYEQYCMNGDYTKEGKELLNTYYDIIHLAGYNHIKRYIPENLTSDLLKPSYSDLDEEERMLLHNQRLQFKKI
jgi:hypothetical protein